MNDKHANFDDPALFHRKDNHAGYRFCPLCAGPLELRTVDLQERMVCIDEKCGFVFYQNPIPAAGAIVVKDDRVLLVKRAHPPRIGWWCIPAGFMEWHEHPTETTIREMEEETGLIVKLGPLFDIYTGTDDPRVNAVLILYLADEAGGRLQAGDDAEEVDWFGFDELPEKIAFESHIRALDDYSRRYRNNVT